MIKLMGRDAGFVAAHAALASNLVDLVLVPEACNLPTTTCHMHMTHAHAHAHAHAHMPMPTCEAAAA